MLHLLLEEADRFLKGIYFCQLRLPGQVRQPKHLPKTHKIKRA